MDSKQIFRYENESNTIYNFRKNFIENYKTNDEDFNTIVKYSKILANIKFKKCVYDVNIYDKLKIYL